MRGTLTINLLSDTCFSMPAALNATVDTDFAFDALGLPTIAGKTLHGLLRDTWLSCGSTLGYTDAEGWALLGRPLSHELEGSIRIGNAHMDANVQAWVKWAQKRSKPLSRIEITDAFAAVRTLTREERTTGAPARETLRMVRVVPAGTILQAPLHFAVPLTSRQSELLHLLVQLTRHAGLDRNRGLGHLQLTLTDLPLAVTASSPTVSATISTPAISATSAIPAAQANQSGTSGKTMFLPLAIKLTAPCLISDQAVEPNSSITRQYVTGAALRGAVAAALERMKTPPQLFADIIVSGKVRFLNAYPDADGTRSLPVPLTWQRDKDPAKIDGVASPMDALATLFATVPADENSSKEESRNATGSTTTTQRQPVQSRFYAVKSSTVFKAAETRRSYRTHQSRHRATGTTKPGGEDTVFVYESLDGGQTFQGAIALPADRADIRQTLQSALSSEIWLGRSARSGYGGSPDITASKAEQVQEPGSFLTDIAANERFSLRLTSDAVLRNPITGEHDPYCLPDLIRNLLQTRLAGKATIVELEGDAAACIKKGELQGYHRLWRTHLPRIPCASAGSVVLLQAKENSLSREEIEAFQSVPLGERLAEGCGCFVIEPLRKDPLRLTESADNSTATRPVGMAQQGLIDAQRRVYRVQIRNLAARKAQEVAQSPTTTRLVSISLMQRLRISLRSPGWQTTLAQWLISEEAIRNLPGPQQQTALAHRLKKTALEPLTRARVDNISMVVYLRQAAQANWMPDLDSGADAAKQRWEMCESSQSQQIWDEERQAAGVFFLDTLLSLMAKRARTLGTGSSAGDRDVNPGEENQ